MVKDIKRHVGTCHLCNCYKNHRLCTPKARVYPESKSKWAVVHLDITGPLDQTDKGHRYILVLCDRLTRYTCAFALRNKSAEEVARALKKFVELYGCPEKLVSDQGCEFLNSTIRLLMTYYKIKHVTTLPYRPSANGLVESHNKLVLNVLRFLAHDNSRTWDSHLNLACFIINSGYNASIGDSSYYLMFLQDARMPWEKFVRKELQPLNNIHDFKLYTNNVNEKLLEVTSRYLKKAQEENVRRYNQRYKAKDVKIKVGDRVYAKRMQFAPSKLATRFLGPYRVLKITNDRIELRNLNSYKTMVSHPSRLKVVREDLCDNIESKRPFPVDEQDS